MNSVGLTEELRAGDPPSVGPFRLLRRLGAGGMGQVFLGRSATGRLVAVKVIRPELAGEPGFRARFAREVAAARKVSGLFTAQLVDADLEGPVPWLATAYVAGPSLAAAVTGHGPLPAVSVLTLAAGLAEGLAAIHAAGVVHRDLKPSNVLLANDGPRVIDFGISRAAEASALTQSGTVIGSPGFMSPEQAEGGTIGPPSDVFSLGAVLAFAATGENPFGTGPTPALIYRLIYHEPGLARVPEPLRPLIERCLAKNPAQRPTTADLLAELGAGQLAADWLPTPLTEVLGGYVLPERTTVTSEGIHPAEEGTAGSSRPADPAGRPRGRENWRRLTWIAVVAGLLAGSVPAAMALSSTAGSRPSAGPTAPHTTISAPAHSPRTAPATAAAMAKKASRNGTHSPSSQTRPRAATSPSAPSNSPASAPVDSPVASPASEPATGTVPDVLDMTLSAAASALKAHGFSNIPYLYDCYGSPDVLDVVRQLPGAGVRIALTAPVQLYLQADNCSTVPNVVGMNLSNAAYTLKQVGFSNIPYLYGCYGSAGIGAVVSQSPAPGTSYGRTEPVSLKLQANNC